MICLLVLMLSAFSASPAEADNLFIEAGPGIFNSMHSDGIFLRYQKDTPPLFDRASYWNAILGHWNNGNRAEAFGVARGVFFNHEKKQSFSATFGLLGVNRKTHNLGTRFQFYIRFGYNFTIERHDLAFSLVHVSNGKLVFGWDGPNSGENFLTLAVGLF